MEGAPLDQFEFVSEGIRPSTASGDLWMMRMSLEECYEDRWVHVKPGEQVDADLLCGASSHTLHTTHTLSNGSVWKHT